MAKSARPKSLELSPDEKIIQEAKTRFQRVSDWESSVRRLYVADVKFANADSDNSWQWPDDLRRDRETNKRPCLTINKVKNHVALITNDMRMNKPSVSVKPVGDETNYDAAQIYEGIIRHIEYISSAPVIYADAGESQVEGGFAYWRVNSRYVSDEANVDSFSQELVIEPLKDHLAAYLDCDAKQKNRLDSKYGFVFEELPKDEAENLYDGVDFTDSTGLGETDDWVTRDNVRIAEYYRITTTPDEIVYMKDPEGNESTDYLSDIPEDGRAQVTKLKKEPGDWVIRTRKVRKPQLEWFKIAGNKIIERKDGKDGSDKLPGKYIPIIIVVGIERVIEGKLERKGLVRALKDPQRMYNYNSSGQVEYGALATKTPWVGPAAAFEGNEVAWNNANRSNAAYLTFKHMDAEGNQLPAPTRPDAPGSSPAFMDGMKISAAELEMASGQYGPQQPGGAQQVERTPRAINARQHFGDMVNAHFNDNFAVGVAATGIILLDMIPHYYDTERVIQILGKDGTETDVLIKPDADKAYEKKQLEDEIQVIFNPRKGRYAVQADVGPAYATQRQEAWNAFVEIVTGAPAFLDEFGDLMFLSADFPTADKIAERYRKKLRAEKPYLFDDNAATPGMQQLQQQLKDSGEQVAELMGKLAEMRLKLVGKDQKRDIEANRAETDRVYKLANSIADMEGDPQMKSALEAMVLQTLRGMFGSDITDIIDADQAGEGEQPGALQDQGEEHPQVPGAKRAPDGNFYLPDPGRPGKYLQVNDQQQAA